MFKKALANVKRVLSDERGVLTTVEVIGYSVLLIGAVALTGYGFTALARGKTANIMSAGQTMKAMQGSVSGASGYGYATTGGATVDANTGIIVGAAGN